MNSDKTEPFKRLLQIMCNYVNPTDIIDILNELGPHKKNQILDMIVPNDDYIFIPDLCKIKKFLVNIAKDIPNNNDSINLYQNISEIYDTIMNCMILYAYDFFNNIKNDDRKVKILRHVSCGYNNNINIQSYQDFEKFINGNDEKYIDYIKSNRNNCKDIIHNKLLFNIESLKEYPGTLFGSMCFETIMRDFILCNDVIELPDVYDLISDNNNAKEDFKKNRKAAKKRALANLRNNKLNSRVDGIILDIMKRDIEAEQENFNNQTDNLFNLLNGIKDQIGGSDDINNNQIDELLEVFEEQQKKSQGKQDVYNDILKQINDLKNKVNSNKDKDKNKNFLEQGMENIRLNAMIKELKNQHLFDLENLKNDLTQNLNEQYKNDLKDVEEKYKKNIKTKTTEIGDLNRKLKEVNHKHALDKEGMTNDINNAKEDVKRANIELEEISLEIEKVKSESNKDVENTRKDALKRIGEIRKETNEKINEVREDLDEANREKKAAKEERDAANKKAAAANDRAAEAEQRAAAANDRAAEAEQKAAAAEKRAEDAEKKAADAEEAAKQRAEEEAAAAAIQQPPPRSTVVKLTNKQILDLVKNIIDDLNKIYYKMNLSLQNINKSGNSLQNLNPVYHKTTDLNWDYKECGKNTKRLTFYEGNYEEFVNCIYAHISTLNTDQGKLDVFNYIYRTIKNDFELLRGPVRVYLKLKPAVTRVGEVKDENHALFKSIQGNSFKVNITNFCDKILQKEIDNVYGKDNKQRLKNIYQYLNPQFENNLEFSEVYNENQSSQEIFNLSVKNTVENMVGVSDTAIMAYGPSGSGKTYNLIGAEDDNNIYKIPDENKQGIIYKSIKYLIENRKDLDINQMSLSSKQFYLACPQTCEGKTIEFDSLKPFIDKESDFVEKYINGNTSILQFLNNSNNNFTYRYEINDKILTWNEFVTKNYKGNDYKQTRESLVVTIDGKTIFRKINLFTFFQDIPGNHNMKKLRFREFASYFVDIDNFKQIKGGSSNIFLPNNLRGNNLLNNNFSIYKKESITYDEDFLNLRISNIISTVNKFMENVNNELRLKTLSGIALMEPKNNEALTTVSKFLSMEQIINYGNAYKKQFDFVHDVSSRNISDDDFNLNKVDLDIENSVIVNQEIFTRFYVAIKHGRPTRATPLNPESSRSHLVININITSNTGEKNKLMFIDLAGNEEATKNLFQMREEGNGITTSLFAIKDVLKDKQENLPSKNEEELIIKYTNEKYRDYFKGGTKMINCKNLYVDFYQRLAKLFTKQGQSKDVTVSIYLNSPTYMYGNKTSENIQRCKAIADSLYFVHDLLEKSSISAYLVRDASGMKDTIFKQMSFGRRKLRKVSKKKVSKSKKSTTNMRSKSKKKNYRKV